MTDTPNPDPAKQQPPTDSHTAFMQLGQTGRGERAVLTIGDRPPLVGTYNGCGMRKVEGLPAMLFEPQLAFPDPTEAQLTASRPAGLDALLDHVAADLPDEPTTSPALSALADALLDEERAPSPAAAYSAARIALAQHTRELSAMLHAAAHARCDCCLDQVARLDEHAATLDRAAWHPDTEQPEPAAAEQPPAATPPVDVLERALRTLLADLDYDLHKATEHGEEDGLDHYPELAAQFAATLAEEAGR